MHNSWIEMALAKCLIRLSLSGINSELFLLFPAFSSMFKFYQILSLILFLKISI